MVEPVLQGKVVLITGAGRGIGAALAVGFAQAGAAVTCVARTEAQINMTVAVIAEKDGKALAVVADVTDMAAMQQAVARTVTTFGGLDVLVVNAGVNLDRRTITESVVEDWITTVQVNLIGAYISIKAAVPAMIERGGGQIITVGSGFGHRAVKARTAYGSSKAGLWMLTRAASEDLWEQGICVNELIPGPVATDMRAANDDDSGRLNLTREWEKPPGEVLPLAVWLASNDRHGPTGQSFSLMRRDAQ